MQEYVVTYSGDEVDEKIGNEPKFTLIINHYWEKPDELDERSEGK